MKSKSQTIHILMLIDHLGVGGAQVHLTNLVTRLQEFEDLHITICSLHADNHIYASQFEKIGVEVIFLSTTREKRKLFKIAKQLHTLLKSRDINLIHTFLHASYIIGVPVAKLRRIPVLHSFLSAIPQMPKWYLLSLLFFQFVTDRFIVTNHKNKLKFLMVNTRKRYRLAPLALDFGPYYAIQHDPQVNIAPYDLDAAYPVVLSIGRLHPDKGHQYVIEAWERISRVFPEGRLLIVGSGLYEEKLKRITKKLHLSHSVLFTGFREDIATIFARGDIFCRTSINEGANLVTAQALAAGLPVIGFKNQATEEIIVDQRNGILIDSHDPDRLADVILELAQDKQKMAKFQYNSKETRSILYDLERSNIRHKEIYKELLNIDDRKIRPV